MNRSSIIILGVLTVTFVVMGFVALDETSTKRVIATKDAPGAIGPLTARGSS